VIYVEDYRLFIDCETRSAFETYNEELRAKDPSFPLETSMFAVAAMILASSVIPIAPAPSGAPRAIVRTDDLNLGSAAGAAELRRRVDQAVLALSGRGSITGSLFPSADVQRARAYARQEADRKIAAARQNEVGHRLEASSHDDG
jgi:UrcA family protein